MSKDKLDDLLAFGGGFDWITPLLDLAKGYNKVEIEGDPATCEAKKRELQAQGIKCRVDFTGFEWRVISVR